LIKEDDLALEEGRIKGREGGVGECGGDDDKKKVIFASSILTLSSYVSYNSSGIGSQS